VGQAILPDCSVLLAEGATLRVCSTLFLVKVGWEGHDSAPGELTEALLTWLLDFVVFVCVVHVAMLVSAKILLLRAKLDFEEIWVEVTFVPTVRIRAVEALGARILINTNRFLSVPTGAHIFRVLF